MCRWGSVYIFGLDSTNAQCCMAEDWTFNIPNRVYVGRLKLNYEIMAPVDSTLVHRYELNLISIALYHNYSNFRVL